MNRRSFLIQGTAAMSAGAILPQLQAATTPAPPPIRIGACMVGLRQAREAGLQGVELNVGAAAERLEIADEAVRRKYKEQMGETTLPVCSLMMELLNAHPFASDPARSGLARPKYRCRA